MSARRFCAVDDELWDSVPSRAPNNLCPRFRSSSCPVLRRSLNRSDLWGGDPSLANGSVSVFSLRPSLGLFDSEDDIDDCLLFKGFAFTGSGSSSVSGRMTADATALVVYQHE